MLIKIDEISSYTLILLELAFVPPLLPSLSLALPLLTVSEQIPYQMIHLHPHSTSKNRNLLIVPHSVRCEVQICSLQVHRDFLRFRHELLQFSKRRHGFLKHPRC